MEEARIVGHSDIEIYDGKARDLGSADPVSGKQYRAGTFEINKHLEKLL